MSEQHEPLNPEQQDALLQDIVVVLSHSLPAGWQVCHAEHSTLGAYAETTARIERLNGPPTDVDVPPALAELFERLRAGMGQPGVGTWFTARVQLDFPAHYRAAYDYDGQPEWSTPPHPEAYEEERRRFPRDPEHTPGWLAGPVDVASADTSVDSSADPSVDSSADSSADADAESSADMDAETTPDMTGVTTAAAVPVFRTARLFDSMGPGQTPQFDRPPVPDDEAEALVAYLTKAPIVLAARSLDTDLIDPARPAKVPLTYLTDGTWIWPGGVGYYFSTHGVPPEPELVDHIRRQGFQPPDVDDYTREAAAASVMGAPPPPRPQAAPPEPSPLPPPAAPQPPAPEAAPPDSVPPDSVPPVSPVHPEPPVQPEPLEPEPVLPEDVGAAAPHPAVDEEGERRALEQLRVRLTELGTDPRAYSLGSVADDTWCLVQEGGGWAVFRFEQDGRGLEAVFSDVDRAAAYLLGTLLLVPSRMNPYGAPPQPAAPPVGGPVTEPVTRPDVPPPGVEASPPPGYEGQIEPLDGEPPLTLFRNVRELELAAGTEIDRFGDPAGNLMYAAGTHYTLRSLPPEWSDRPYHLYRLRHPLRVLIGTAVPWFDQPGGGTGYYLPVSIGRLLADGVLVEIEPPAA